MSDVRGGSAIRSRLTVLKGSSPKSLYCFSAGFSARICVPFKAMACWYIRLEGTKTSLYQHQTLDARRLQLTLED